MPVALRPICATMWYLPMVLPIITGTNYVDGFWWIKHVVRDIAFIIVSAEVKATLNAGPQQVSLVEAVEHVSMTTLYTLVDFLTLTAVQ